MEKLKVFDGRYSICKLPSEAGVPKESIAGEFWSLTITSGEVSLVCPEGSEPDGAICETGWRVLEVTGPLDFSQVGIISGISTVLASAGLSIFVLSTYDTDYLLVKGPRLPDAVQTLRAAGYGITCPDPMP
jgi:uncharacterized protein